MLRWDDEDVTVHEDVLATAVRGRAAADVLRTLTRADKDEALLACADALLAATDEILVANATDVARSADLPAATLDRLTLTPARIAAIAAALRDVAALPDPVGEIVRGSRLANGMRLRQVRVPFGVVGIVYEARPNVTVDAAGLCLKSGNSVLLRGSSSARSSNEALVKVLRSALAGTAVPADAVQLVPGDTRESVEVLMRLRGHLDLLVPRGGAGLIRSVVEGATVPVIETGVGNCHVYVDASADLDLAVPVILNAKASKPSVCNSAETLLVHAAVADAFVPRIVKELQAAGVTVHGDPRVFAMADGVVPATDDEWAQEYLSLDMAVAVVADLAGAVDHIRRWSSQHTEAVLATDQRVVDAFIAAVDSAAIAVNASTRFTDGGEFGMGAELGISTQKMHARGPMGLPEMTTTTWIYEGTGQTR